MRTPLASTNSPPGYVHGRGIGGSTSRSTSRSWSARCCSGSATTFDTKFDLTADPGAFMVRSLHLWNPQSSFGDLQNQAYGYLFPQGTFFLTLEHVGVADWVVQRVWSALLLLAAYEGARRLCLALGIGERGYAAIAGGLAFASAPRLLGLSGVLTAEILPTAVLPWVVLPLVLGLGGRLNPRRAGLWSGVAVLFMGGVNAVENLAALPLALFLVCTGLKTASGRRLAGWWALGTTLASMWWFLPLLILGKYSPPFLHYIETSSATTGPLGWANSLRGADHWLAYVFVGGRPWWPAAYDLATSPFLVVMTGCVAALSLFGLFSRQMPFRTPLVLSLLTGLVCLTIAHAGAIGSPIDAFVRSLLDGALAPLRNVHKVDPLVRLPLALGFARTFQLATRAASRLPAKRGKRPIQRPGLLSATVSVVLFALVAMSAQPAFADRLRKPGWAQVPDAWVQAAEYLGDRATGTTLILPGTGFGQQWWGWTIDEPLQGVAQSPWVSRSQVPLIPGQSIRFLDSIEERIEDGVGSFALADLLARSGISHVVVRRDLDLFAAEVPAPDRVDQALSRSPDIKRVAGFGRSGFGDQPLIDVFKVQRDVSQVAAPLFSDAVTMAGGPEDILTALESGELDASRPMMFTNGEKDADPPAIVADGYRRVERQFGRVHDAVSQVMTGGEKYRTKRREHDYAGVDGMERVVSAYSGVRSVVASSSSGYADTFGAVRADLGPASAVDADVTTYWRSAPFQSPVGQWIELRLASPRKINRARVVLGVDGVSGAVIRRVRVTVGDRSQIFSVDPRTGTVELNLDGVGTDKVRVTVVEVAGHPSQAVVAVREVQLDDRLTGRELVVPDSGADSSTSFVFRARAPRRPCVNIGLGPDCDVTEARPGPEQGTMARRFSVDEGGTWTLRGRVVARPTIAAADLLAPVGEGVQVQASSMLGGDAAVAAAFAYDGDVTTPWLADPGDQSPRLILTWNRPRTINRLLLSAAAVPAKRPTVATLNANGETRVVQTGTDAFGFFEPLRTRRLTITFEGPRNKDTRTTPLGIGDMNIDGLDPIRYTPDPNAGTGTLCGLGPEVVVDGVIHKTQVDGTIADIVTGNPMNWAVCDGSVQLDAGTHHIWATSTAQFAPTILSLAASESRTDRPVRSRAVSVVRWEPVHRTVKVGPGEAAILRVSENANAGWIAHLNGKQLASVEVDGWQQAFRIPAGNGGTIRLIFEPDVPYRLMLLIGGLSALFLVAAAGFSLRLRSSVPTSAVAWSPGLPRPVSWPKRIGVIALFAAVAWVLGGPVVAGVGVLAALLRLKDSWLVPAGALLVAGASGLAAASDSLRAGNAGLIADTAAAAAVGLLLVSMSYERQPPLGGLPEAADVEQS